MEDMSKGISDLRPVFIGQIRSLLNITQAYLTN